jgi:hypothetical protein
VIETLLQKLAGDDKALRAQLERLLGAETFVAAKPEPAAIVSSTSTVKQSHLGHLASPP